MKIKVICVAYDRPIELGILIGCFQLQTDPNWELYIIYDGPVPRWYKDLIKKHQKDKRINFYNSEKRTQCFGHPNRRAMLKKLRYTEGDYLLMTNDDNYYVPRFIEFMLSVCGDKTGMAYCNTIHSHFEYKLNMTEIKKGRIDIGAFIVRLDIAKEAGFKHDDFAADGDYAEECKALCDKKRLDTYWLQKPLFIHN